MEKTEEEVYDKFISDSRTEMHLLDTEPRPKNMVFITLWNIWICVKYY